MFLKIFFKKNMAKTVNLKNNYKIIRYLGMNVKFFLEVCWMKYLTLNLEEVQKFGLNEIAVLSFLKLKKNDSNIKGQIFFSVKLKEIHKNLKLKRYAVDTAIKNLIEHKLIKKTVNKKRIFENVRFCIEKKVSQREYLINTGAEFCDNTASLKNKHALSANKHRCRKLRQHRSITGAEFCDNTASTQSGLYISVINKLITLRNLEFSDENSERVKNFESVRKNIMQYINGHTLKSEGSTCKQSTSLKVLKGGEMNSEHEMNSKAKVDLLEGQKNVIAAEEILKYFNEVCNKKFKETAKRNQKNIIDRLNEGFTIEDFKKVIEYKNRVWGKGVVFSGGVKARTYLRPETLFSEKNFENYLNEYEPAPKLKMSQDTINFINKWSINPKELSN